MPRVKFPDQTEWTWTLNGPKKYALPFSHQALLKTHVGYTTMRNNGYGFVFTATQVIIEEQEASKDFSAMLHSHDFK